MELTREQILEVPCIVCDAAIGNCCNQGNSIPLIGFHKERATLRAKLPTIAATGALSATDKALIVYYAYVIMADSVAANSKALFGKEVTTEEIQRFFGAKAVEELKKDGLLK